MIEYLYLIALSWFIVELEPLQELISFGHQKALTYSVRKKYTYLRLAADLIDNVLSCWMCLSFWITFAYTFNFLEACLISFVVWIVSSLVEKK